MTQEAPKDGARTTFPMQMRPPMSASPGLWTRHHRVFCKSPEGILRGHRLQRWGTGIPELGRKSFGNAQCGKVFDRVGWLLSFILLIVVSKGTVLSSAEGSASAIPPQRQAQTLTVLQDQWLLRADSKAFLGWVGSSTCCRPSCASFARPAVRWNCLRAPEMVGASRRRPLRVGALQM